MKTKTVNTYRSDRAYDALCRRAAAVLSSDVMYLALRPMGDSKTGQVDKWSRLCKVRPNLMLSLQCDITLLLMRMQSSHKTRKSCLEFCISMMGRTIGVDDTSLDTLAGSEFLYICLLKSVRFLFSISVAHQSYFKPAGHE
jgi:hypothetical protein